MTLRRTRLAVEDLEGRLTPTFALTIDVCEPPAATNPYVSEPPTH